MNQANIKLCSELIDSSYVNLAANSLFARENTIKVLLSQRCLPNQGWDDLTIQYFLDLMAIMDTNNIPGKVGVGEREGRIYSKLVEQRNYHMGHGIGRSGDVAAVQPKAAGSSIILKLTKFLARDAIKLCGYQDVKHLLLVPLATGMALSLCLLTLKSLKPNAKYVLWPRIDQKTCLKCILTANLEPIVIENVQEGDCITTNLVLIEQKIEELGADNIVCILSTTSCFAPRIPDKIEEISLICKEKNIAHLVNNAYGLQCTKIANQFNQGHAKGRIDLVVQSTDKNFMVPVGGAIIYGYNKELVKKVSEVYPGRASAAPILDLFITLLSMGREGLLRLLKQRKVDYEYFMEKLVTFAGKHQEKVLDTKKNSISIAITLNGLKQKFIQNYEKEEEQNEVTKLGAVLYAKKVMGSRILTDKEIKKVSGFEFKNYGSHIDTYQNMPYMTVACAIGMNRNEIDGFMSKLEDGFK